MSVKYEKRTLATMFRDEDGAIGNRCEPTGISEKIADLVARVKPIVMVMRKWLE